MNVAIVGVSTLAGENLFEILEESSLEIDQLVLLDSEEEAGRALMFRGHSVRVRPLEGYVFTDIALAFVADPDLSLEQLEALKAAGVQLIDLFPARQGSAARLVVPEVNASVLSTLEPGQVIGCPSAAATAAVLALAPMQADYQLLRLNIVALMSAAELGRPGVEALAAETARLLNGRDAETGFLPHQFAFNLIPQAGQMAVGGYTDVELRLVEEVREVLQDEQIEIVVNTVQAPLFYGVTVLLQAETQLPVDLEAARERLSKFDGVELPDEGTMVSPVGTVSGKDPVYLTRFRLEPDNDCGFGICAITDNLRKGSALNAVQVAAEWIKSRV